MGKILFVGGGIVGTCAAMMLANDGHDVTVVERDPTPVPPPDTAWDEWDRTGVNQFRMLHFFLARFREVADAELPGLTDAIVAAGGLRMNPLVGIPEEITGGWLEGDERFEVVTARRPVAESVVAQVAASTPGLTVRRGVGVAGVLTTAGADGIVHVTGVRTADGEELTADLVVDAGGRRSSMPAWLREAGSPGPQEMIEDCGFVYYGRHFRSADGSIPPAFGGLVQPYGSISTLTLPADNGTWGVGVVTSSRDAALRGLLDNVTWEKVVRSFPMVAHWIDAEPITDVKLMAKIEDRQRTYVVGGTPVATGIVPLADSWACTNPSLGRGISIGLIARGRAAQRCSPRICSAISGRWRCAGASSRTSGSSRCSPTRCRSTVIAWPRSKPRSPGVRTRLMTRVGSSPRPLPTRSRRARICCAAS